MMGRACWSKFNASTYGCNRCWPSHPSILSTIFLVCSTDEYQAVTSSFNPMTPGTVYANGIPSMGDIRAPIYFLDDPSDSTIEIQMKKFEVTQPEGRILHVKCSVSRYEAAMTFQFALEFEGQSDLFLLSPDLDTTYENQLELYSQIAEIRLVNLPLKKIHCSASIANTYNWLHTSRDIQVLGELDFYRPGNKCQESLGPPDLSLYHSGTTRLSTSFRRVYKIQYTKQITVELFCASSNQVYLLFDYVPSSRVTLAKATDSKYTWEFDNFENSSSYKFQHWIELTFNQIQIRQIFRCVTNKDPCSQSSVEYSVLNETNQVQFTLLNSTRDLDLSRRRPNETECEPIFYYEETREFPGYNFYCQFPFQESGTVKVHDVCTNAAQCMGILDTKRQSTSCWKQYTANDCRNCKKQTIKSYAPFVATCRRSSGGLMTYYEESKSTIVFFGISPKNENRNAIYFGDNEGTTHNGELDMLQIDAVDPLQILNENIQVKCRGSKFYLAASIYVALSYHGTEQLEIVHETAIGSTDGDNTNAPLYVTEVTRTIPIKNLTLNRVYCLAWSLATEMRMNVSSPITVLETTKPRVVISTKIKSTIGNINDYVEDFNKTFQWQPNLGDRDLYCSAIGKPLGIFRWSFNGQAIPEEKSAVVDESWSWTKIVPRSSGLYTCHISNFHGVAIAKITVNIKESAMGYVGQKTIVAIVLPIVFTFMIFGGVIFLLWRRNKRLAQCVRQLTDEEIQNFIQGDPKCDPSDAYGAIHARPYNSKYEIPLSFLQFDEKQILGSGEFGMVMKGFLNKDDERTLVAIKTIKNNANVDTLNVQGFLSEIKIMAYLERHEHIVSLIAACTENMKQCQVYAAVEFCENGDLLQFLRSNRQSFSNVANSRVSRGFQIDERYQNPQIEMSRVLTAVDLMHFSTGIAHGLSYLASKNVIHGDIAARNILLTKNLNVKISDFGLSRQMKNYSDYVKTKGVPLPFKWLSVEILTDMKFSLKSDVWSYGVLLFEIFSLGQVPYPGCNWNSEFVQKIVDGYRMKKPEFASDKMYEIMIQCWTSNPNQRPSIGQVERKLCEIKSLLAVDYVTI